VFDQGSTVLSLAASRNLDKVARLLIDHGANITRRNTSGETPLMACISDPMSPAILTLLLEEYRRRRAVPAYQEAQLAKALARRKLLGTPVDISLALPVNPENIDDKSPSTSQRNSDAASPAVAAPPSPSLISASSSTTSSSTNTTTRASTPPLRPLAAPSSPKASSSINSASDNGATDSKANDAGSVPGLVRVTSSANIRQMFRM
jgi:ankyrin repeat protein